MFERLGGIAGDGIEAPGAFSGFGVVSGEVAADSLLGSAGSHNHLAFDDANGGGEDSVTSRYGILRRPDHLAGLLVESHDTAVEQSGIDASIVKSHTPVNRSAAETLDALARDIRIPTPFSLAGARIYREHHIPRENAIENSVV